MFHRSGNMITKPVTSLRHVLGALAWNIQCSASLTIRWLDGAKFCSYGMAYAFLYDSATVEGGRRNVNG